MILRQLKSYLTSQDAQESQMNDAFLLHHAGRELATVKGNPPFDLNFLDTEDDFFIFYITGSLLCIICASIAAGMTMGYLGLDPFKLRVTMKTGSIKEKEYVKQIMPLLKDHHRILATCLLFNTIANES